MKKKPKLKEYVWYHTTTGNIYVFPMRTMRGYEDREHQVFIHKTKILLEPMIWLGAL